MRTIGIVDVALLPAGVVWLLATITATDDEQGLQLAPVAYQDDCQPWVIRR
jgi:hypothetical protein